MRIAPVQQPRHRRAHRPPAPACPASSRGPRCRRSRAGRARTPRPRAAASSGAGYSQASRLSFMPCSASTTAQGRIGAAVRQPGPIGQARAVRHHEGIGRSPRALLDRARARRHQMLGAAAQQRIAGIGSSKRASASVAHRQRSPVSRDRGGKVESMGRIAIIRPSPAIEDAKQQDGRHRRQPDADRDHPCRRPHRRLRRRRQRAGPSARVPAHRGPIGDVPLLLAPLCA